MSLCTSWKKIIILICVRGWHQIGWKETKHWADVETTQQRSRFGRTNIFLGSCAFGLHSTTMRNKQRYCGQPQNHAWITNFRKRNWKNTILQKSSHFFVVYVWPWLVMQRNVWNDIVSWRTRRLNNSTKCLLHASMTTTSKEEELKSVGELSTVRSQIVLKCLFETCWTTREQTCMIDHHTCEYKTVLPCGKHCQTMQTGTVSWLRFCKRPWRLKIHFWRNIVRFWMSYVCSNELDVQETNCCFSQFNRIWNHLSGHGTEIGWFARSGTVGSNDFCSWKCFSCFRLTGILRVTITNTTSLVTKSMWWKTLIPFLQMSNPRVKKLCCVCLRTMKLKSRWLLKAEVLQWDTSPEPTDLLLIGCSLESIWTPKIQIKHIDTKNQLADTLTQRKCHTQWIESSFVFENEPFQFHSLSKVLSERTKKSSSEGRITAQSKSMMNLVSRFSERTPDVLASIASESLEKTRHQSQQPLRSWNEQHQRTGRLVSDAWSSNYSVECSRKMVLSRGNLMNWWKKERDLFMNNHPLCSQSTRTDSLSMTMIWSLTPTQIIHVVIIQIILAQGEWLNTEEAKTILKKCNTRQQQTFINMRNVYVFDIGSIWIPGKEKLRNCAFHQKYKKRSRNGTDVRHIWKVDNRTIRWDLRDK